MEFSFTSFKYDAARVKDRLNRATIKGRYYLNVPGPLNSSCYMEDPQIRLQGFGANNMSVNGGHPIDIDSDLQLNCDDQSPTAIPNEVKGCIRIIQILANVPIWLGAEYLDTRTMDDSHISLFSS